MTTSRLIQASLVACGALWLADLEQPDLAEVDARERMAEEGVEARFVDLHVEDGTASCRNTDGLDPLLPAAHIRVDVGTVENRPDDVEVGVEARASGHDVEADEVPWVGGEGMRGVLARIAVPCDPIRDHRVRLAHIVLRGRLDPRHIQVPLARPQYVFLIGLRQRLCRIDDDRALHSVCDVCEYGL